MIWSEDKWAGFRRNLLVVLWGCFIAGTACRAAVGSGGLYIPPVPVGLPSQPVSHTPPAHSRAPVIPSKIDQTAGGQTAKRAAHAATPIARQAGRHSIQSFDFQVVSTSHPAGIYHVGQTGVVNLLIVNKGPVQATLGGRLQWKKIARRNMAIHAVSTRPRNSGLPVGHGGIASVKIKPTPVAAGRELKIALPVNFRHSGRYELQWQFRHAIRPIFGPVLAIHPPHGAALPEIDSQWIANVPAAFFQPKSADCIQDYIRQTGIRRFLLNIDFGKKPSADTDRRPREIPGLIRLMQTIRRQGGYTIIRLNIIAGAAGGDFPAKPALKRWLMGNILPATGAVQAVVVNPVGFSVRSRHELAGRAVPLAAEQLLFRRITEILHSYAPNVQVVPELKKLGGDAYCPLSPHIFNSAASRGSGPTVAITDAPGWLAFMYFSARFPSPPTLWVLPQLHYNSTAVIHLHRGRVRPGNRLSPLMALVAGATVVPVHAGLRFGAMADLLGGAVAFATVHSRLPPEIAVFQGNGRSVAIVAGLGAGSLHDALWRYWTKERIKWRRRGQLAGNKWHILRPGRFPAGEMTVYDPEDVMQSFDASGRRRPTPFPGEQHIPLDSHFYFLTATASARNLVASLRTAEIHGYPLAFVAATCRHERRGAAAGSLPGASPAKALASVARTARGAGYSEGGKTLLVYVRIRNAAVGHLRGSVRIAIAANHAGRTSVSGLTRTHILREQIDLPSGQFEQWVIPVSAGGGDTQPHHLRLHVHLQTNRFTEHVQLVLKVPHPID